MLGSRLIYPGTVPILFPARTPRLVGWKQQNKVGLTNLKGSSYYFCKQT